LRCLSMGASGRGVQSSRFVFYRANYAFGMILERRRKSREIG